MITKFIKSSVNRISFPIRHSDEPEVQNGLAVTPAQMLEMTARGIPITPANLGLSYDMGYSKLDFEPPMEFARGVDIGQMWEASQRAKKRVKDGIKKALDNKQKGE